MGAERARRWKLLPSFRSLSLPPASPSKPNKRRPALDFPLPPPAPAARKDVKEEEVPVEFLCPILRATMADPVILPSGRTYERACVRACAELGLSLAAEGNAPAGGGGGGGGVSVAIPNDALRSAVRTRRRGRPYSARCQLRGLRTGRRRTSRPLPMPRWRRRDPRPTCRARRRARPLHHPPLRRGGRRGRWSRAKSR
ncbi:unnamed protein product [Urochloa humidicola]